jgi:hypothetical protein
MTPTPDLVLGKEQHSVDFRSEHARRGGFIILFAGMGADLAAAHQPAADRVRAYLVGERGLEPFEACAYASARLEMRLGGPASPIVLASLPEALA